MRQFFATLIATIAAALAPALIVTCLFYVFGGKDSLPTLPLVFIVALVVAFLHTLLFGLLTAGWLLRVGKFRFMPMLVAALVIGVVSAAIWQQPYKHGSGSSSWDAGVQKLNNGVPTLASWLDYLEFITCAGILGAIGGIAFYFVYQGMSPNNSFKPKPLRGSNAPAGFSGGSA
jgi:hypothetical protein